MKKKAQTFQEAAEELGLAWITLNSEILKVAHKRNPVFVIWVTILCWIMITPLLD
jgi:hypothetical protein